MIQKSPSIDLAVVLVNYERAVDTIECINSLRQSTYQPMRIVLVDNGSQDDSIETLSREFPELNLIALPENIKCAGGVNAGIEHALQTGSTHIFVLNNDTILEADAISELMDATWDIAVPKIVYYDQPDIIWSAGARYRRFPASVLMIGLNKKDNQKFNHPGKIEYATGCALLARRKVFEKIGLFDTEFGNYQEDYDFFYRVNAAGFQTGYVPSAKIYHKVSRTLGRNPTAQRYYIGRNAVLFYKKDHRFPAWSLWSHILWVTIREIFKGNFSFIPDYWQGFSEGLRFFRRNLA